MITRSANCSGKELQRWMTDMRWRVNASEAAIKRRFEPVHQNPGPSAHHANTVAHRRGRCVAARLCAG